MNSKDKKSPSFGPVRLAVLLGALALPLQAMAQAPVARWTRWRG